MTPEKTIWVITLLTKSFHGDKDIAKTNLKHFFNSVLWKGPAVVVCLTSPGGSKFIVKEDVNGREQYEKFYDWKAPSHNVSLMQL